MCIRDSNRSGCFVCGDIGCHSWFHEQDRDRVPAETGRDQNSQPPGNSSRRPNDTVRRCRICFNFNCSDRDACINVLRRSRGLRACPSCYTNDCPGPDTCGAGANQNNSQGDRNLSVSSNLPTLSNNSPNANRTTVRGNPSPPSSARPPQN